MTLTVAVSKRLPLLETGLRDNFHQWTPASDRAGSISTADKKANLVRKIRSSRNAQWSASAMLMQAIKGTFSVSLPVAIVNSEDYRSISLLSNYEGMKI